VGQLDDKVAVVLGAAGEGNMGQTVARRFAAEGAKTVVTGRNEAVLSKLANSIGGAFYVADVADKSSMSDLIRFAHDTYGGCNAIVNAVGQNLMLPSLEVTEEQLDSIITTHIKGTYFLLQAAARYMSENGGGSFIQVSSGTVECLIENHSAYIATKAACESLMKSFANEFGRHGVKFNTVSPGYTHTPMTADAAQVPGLDALFETKYPLGRIGTSEDIADAAVWLAQDGSFITGQTLQINGGLNLRGNPTTDELGAVFAALASTD